MNRVWRLEVRRAVENDIAWAGVFGLASEDHGLFMRRLDSKRNGHHQEAWVSGFAVEMIPTIVLY